ncbi:MAG: hypothetical protein JSU63_21675 [Phycisphaerales bacterium]|nr:MAG: hypothetical protein JSU63_21675 [Phycisphaerales bacterium]
MKQVLFLLMGLCVVNAAVAQETPKTPETPETPEEPKAPPKNPALEILEKADAATKAVKLVSYKGEVKATGWVAPQVTAGSGTAVIGGDCFSRPRQFRFDVRFQPAGATATLDVVAGSDGQKYFLIDRADQVVYKGENPAVGGSDIADAAFISMTEYCHPRPFQDELRGEKQELKGKTTIGNEECYEIHVTYSGGQGQAVWFFSTKDNLPRRVDRIVRNQSGEEGVITTTLTDLVVDPKLQDPFQAYVPEGYAESSKFKPRRRTPR